MIKEYFADYYLHRSDITFDFSDGNKMTVHSNVAEPWKVTLVDTGRESQTGGRVRRIRQYVGDEQFMLTYGDGVGNIDLIALLEQHNAQPDKLITISAIQPGGRFGVIDFDDNGNMTGFREKVEEDGGWINAGFMAANKELFDYLDGDSCVLEQAPFRRLATEKKMGAYLHKGYWQCMDTQRDRSYLEERWNANDAPWKVWP
jgi:glucose-1-phosphate cytidylyltransferase